MVEKFIRWFFSELDMYGVDINGGIVGDYIMNKILGSPAKTVDLYVYSETLQNWNEQRDGFIQHIEDVWNIFQSSKIKITKMSHYYECYVYDVYFRIFWEIPYFRTIFTYQSLQYVWDNKKFSLIDASQSSDPLNLLKTINHIKRRQLVPVHTKNFELDHNYFLADRIYYVNIVENAFFQLSNLWHFQPNSKRIHTSCNDICSICMNEDATLKLKIQCGHVFHKDCLKKLLLLDPAEKNSSLCPNCRSPIQVFYK